MRVTIHQPYFMPYLGFFSKVFSSEVLVLYDSAQYVKNRLDNRNYINYKDKKTLLTIPVSKHMSFKPLSEVLISQHYDWRETHLSMLFNAYYDYKYYEIIKDDIADIYSRDYKYLSEINKVFIEKFLYLLGWSGEIVSSSSMKISQEISPSEKLLSILINTNATSYIAGPSSKKYLNINSLESNNIKVNFHNYSNKKYMQKSKEFIPNLSILDYIYNCGTKNFHSFIK